MLDVLFQTADRYGLQLLAVELEASRKSELVKQFQQAGEALSIPVVWRRGEKQLVLEVPSNRSQQCCAVRVTHILLPTGRCDIVGLVKNQQVPRLQSLLAETLVKQLFEQPS